MTPQMRRCTSCGLNRRLTRYVGDRGKVCDWCRRAKSREHARKQHLKRGYAISLDEYERVLNRQGRVCGACRQGRPYNLAVDHDHALADKLGVRASVRGLLCKRCNKVLRDVSDDTVVLYDLITYLISPPARGVL